MVLQPRSYKLRFGLFPLRSPLLGESRFDFFSSAYLDVSVRQVSLPYTMYSCRDNRVLTPIGLPHSDISGSMLSSSSPKLFAGIRVLHRLLMPRHPPLALTSLTKKNLEQAVIWASGSLTIPILFSFLGLELLRSRPNLSPFDWRLFPQASIYVSDYYVYTLPAISFDF